MTCIGKDFIGPDEERTISGYITSANQLPTVYIIGPDEERTISGYITSANQLPTVYIVCPTCGCRILFNAAEITGRKNQGSNTSTPCHCGWHPAYPPEPWKDWVTVEASQSHTRGTE